LRYLVVILAHLVLWTASFVGAVLLRFEFSLPSGYGQDLLVCLPIVLASRTLVFFALNLYHDVWRYSGARALLAILRATVLSSALYATVILAGVHPHHPRSLLLLDAGMAFVLVAGARFCWRIAYGYRLAPSRAIRSSRRQVRRLLILGAGDAGEMLLREILWRHRSRYEPVGFLDDDRRKHGDRIHGVTVLGAIGDLARIASSREVRDVIIAIPSASGTEMRRIVDFCKAAEVSFKTIPGVEDLIDGRVTLNQVRDVAIEDLLGRDPVTLDTGAIAQVVGGRVVLVSGAGGSIGSEICRQVCRFGPSMLVLVERAENNLFKTHHELIRLFPQVAIVPRLADVRDLPRMRAIFQDARPAVVYHTAAHKHVPMLELNPSEGIQNNVFGTKALADLSDHYRVRRFVMVSTDKAVNPTSVMGTTKRIAEMYVQALAQRSRTRFVTVRFGNVMGSSGSVIPVFREQIARGGPITVTHPEMKRYFMTIPEASQLVLEAGAMGKGGEIFILDMGEPVKIVDLARCLVELSGLTLGADIAIQFTGLRPGEKLFEEIAVDEEHADKTTHPKIFVGRSRPISWNDLSGRLEALKSLHGLPLERIRAALIDIVPEYCPTPVPEGRLGLAVASGGTQQAAATG